jgi:GH25 family lysozyme M1 (1,4-beta-N-acetylmuramidase)
MKCTLFTLPFFAAIAAAVPAGQQLEKRADAQGSSPFCGVNVFFLTPPSGIDVSHFQPNVDWSTVKSNGVTFAYIKATESTRAPPLPHQSHHRTS